MRKIVKPPRKPPTKPLSPSKELAILKGEIRGIKFAIKALDAQVAKLVDWAERWEKGGDDGWGDDEGGEDV